MADLSVTPLDSRGSNYVFAVEIENYRYTVRLAPDYYQELTGGKITPEELIKKSFEFLLKREPASAILPEFDLPLINQYFPEYEEAARSW